MDEARDPASLVTLEAADAASDVSDETACGAARTLVATERITAKREDTMMLNANAQGTEPPEGEWFRQGHPPSFYIRYVGM
jgi:hypothetical protein